MKPLTVALLSLIALLNFGQACIDKATYYEIDRDIEILASSINREEELVHFYGGIVRQVVLLFVIVVFCVVIFSHGSTL